MKKAKDLQGALTCEEEIFLKIIKLEKSRGNNSVVIIIMFTKFPDRDRIEKIYDDMRKMLRSYDIISRKNNNIVILIKNIFPGEARRVIKRFKEYFSLNFPEVEPIYIQK